MNPTDSNLAPPSPNLRHAFGGVWRLTYPGFLSLRRLPLLAALLAGLALLTLATTPAANPDVFLDWMNRFYLTFLLPVLAFVSGAGAIRGDLKSHTVDYVFTRPVPRRTFVVFKYLSHLAGVQATGLLALGVLFGVGMLRHIPGLLPALPLLLLTQVLALGVFTAFGFLCGTLTARYLIIGLLYAGIVEVGIGSIPTQLSRLSLTHQLQTLVQPLATGTPGAAPSVQSVVPTAALLLLVSAAMVALTAVVFGQRELAGGKPKEN